MKKEVIAYLRSIGFETNYCGKTRIMYVSRPAWYTRKKGDYTKKDAINMASFACFYLFKLV